MPKYTENLNLFEYDVEKDGKNTYNISQCLNDNWDKIDSALGNVANLTTEQKANFVSAINEIVSNLDKKSSIDLNNLSKLGQSILDRKVEVEALLQQNGYAKFTWKEDNEISNLIIQWGCHRTDSDGTARIILPTSYVHNWYAVGAIHTGGDIASCSIDEIYKTNSFLPIRLRNDRSGAMQGDWGVLWVAIGI